MLTTAKKYLKNSKLGVHTIPGLSTIDDAVPMPGARVVRRYPYAEMGVGQSFYVEGVQMQVVLNGNWRAGKKLGMKFIARREGDGIRVWRSE